MKSTDRRTVEGRTPAVCHCGKSFSGQAGLGLHIRLAHRGRGRGTSNRNERGSSYARAARRAWLLKTFQSDQGPGTCRCYRCGLVLVEETLTVDRIVPGCRGGRYVRNNIRPACSRCNSATGGMLRAA